MNSVFTNRRLRHMAIGYAFVVPALLVYLFFVIQPFLYSIYYSLTDWNGADPVKRFVGFANYRKLLVDPLLWQALYHNLIWVIIGTISPIVIALLLGVLLWGKVRGRLLFRTALATNRLTARFPTAGCSASRRSAPWVPALGPMSPM